jgi:hypothetical protein
MPISLLTPEARELAEYMSQISEDAWCAGWMHGVEVSLWDIVVNGPREYGAIFITTDQVNRIRDLADAAGGWIVFDEEEEETFVPMAEWIRRFDSLASR